MSHQEVPTDAATDPTEAIDSTEASEAGERSDLMEKVVGLCKRRGFIFQSAEIYGGFRSTYDYGPLGVNLLRNVKNAWWEAMVQCRDDVVGLDASILSPPAVWEASGHLSNFSDPLVDCMKCHQRWREDKIEGVCPSCGSTEFTEPRAFNLMFKTHAGPIEDEGAVAYLRPETAQGMFINFANVLQTTRKKPPFGIAQVGKSFRNEITPQNFVFRTREFEQMEMEYFVPPAEAQSWFEYWLQERFNWYLRLGIPESEIRLRHHEASELAHYAAGVADVEFLFPYDHPAEEIKARLDRNGLTVVLFNLPSGNWAGGDRGIAANPDRVQEFRDGVGRAVAYAGILGPPRLNCLAGKVVPGLGRAESWRTLVENVRFAADALAAAGRKLVVEPINHYDIPGFFLNRTQEALDLITEAARPNVYVQYDVYHAQREEGNLVPTLRERIASIDHIQVADNPGRHQPGTGEINYPFLFAELDRLGYGGFVGCEYVPAPDTAGSLGWIQAMGCRLS